jgi:hypothetical protein
VQAPGARVRRPSARSLVPEWLVRPFRRGCALAPPTAHSQRSDRPRSTPRRGASLLPVWEKVPFGSAEGRMRGFRRRVRWTLTRRFGKRNDTLSHKGRGLLSRRAVIFDVAVGVVAVAARTGGQRRIRPRRRGGRVSSERRVRLNRLTSYEAAHCVSDARHARRRCPERT